MADDPLARFLASSVASVFAETITLPTDVAKTRLQVQKVDSSGKPKYSGMLDCFRKISREEGAKGLWKGLNPALVRQVSYSSLSLVLYERIRDGLCTQKEIEGKIPFWKRLAGGGIAGGISIAIFNPTEVIKTQMMNSRTESKTMLGVAKHVYKNAGIPGFWAGVYPNVMRTFLVQAAEIGVYDQAKQSMIPIVGNNFFAHVSASFFAGVASAVTSTPADVVKTRFMAASGGANEYRGIGDAAVRIFTEEGPQALYKGFTPILVRKVVWVTAFFVTYEQFRPIFQSFE